MAQEVKWLSILKERILRHSPTLLRQFMDSIFEKMRQTDANERPDLLRKHARRLTALYGQLAAARVIDWYSRKRGAEPGGGERKRAEVQSYLEKLCDPQLVPEENVMLVLTEISGFYKDNAFLKWLPTKLRAEERAQQARQASQELGSTD